MNVAITGATGFLGLRLLGELLAEHPAVTVLARQPSGEVLRRLMRSCSLIGAPPRFIRELRHRIRVVTADLSEPGLGLAPSTFGELAGQIDVLWHCAGDINLTGDLAVLRQVNVEGTRRVLELASACRRTPVLNHVSTAFVAGKRRDGVVPEAAPSDASGFENSYERSKFEAEQLVHEWAHQHRTPVRIFRPSVLVTDRAPHPQLPKHPMQVLVEQAETAIKLVGAAGPAQVRVVGDPDAWLNLLAVDDAARLMAQLGRTRPARLVDTFHIAHQDDVAVRVLAQAVERAVGIQVRFVPEPPQNPSPLERVMLAQPGVLGYMAHRRRYDITNVRQRLGVPADHEPVGLDYLLAGIRTPVTTAVGHG